MNLVAAVGVILSQLPVPAIDAHEANRNQRLESIAIAISRASERATCSGEWKREGCKAIASDASQVATELLVIANEETALRSNVHRDECKPNECDPSKYRVAGKVHVIHQARSLWQLHKAARNVSEAHEIIMRHGRAYYEDSGTEFERDEVDDELCAYYSRHSGDREGK